LRLALRFQGGGFSDGERRVRKGRGKRLSGEEKEANRKTEEVPQCPAPITGRRRKANASFNRKKFLEN